jgi:hypothetical protein
MDDLKQQHNQILSTLTPLININTVNVLKVQINECATDAIHLKDVGRLKKFVGKVFTQ